MSKVDRIAKTGNEQKSILVTIIRVIPWGNMYFITRRNFLKITRWLVAGVVGVTVLLLIFYNFVFESYEVIGESVQCETNTPFALNYSCKLDIIDNNTQYWSFESNIPEGFVLPRMMVRVDLGFQK